MREKKTAGKTAQAKKQMRSAQVKPGAGKTTVRGTGKTVSMQTGSGSKRVAPSAGKGTGTGSGRSAAAKRTAHSSRAVRKVPPAGKRTKKKRTPKKKLSERILVSIKRYFLEKQKSFLIGGLVIAAAIVIAVGAGSLSEREVPKPPPQEEVRGVWLAYVDFKELGLLDQEKQAFEANVRSFFREAAKREINTVFFHVRAFRDAAYPSEHFPMSRYLWSRKEEIPYDPLKIVIREAHRKGIDLHAWLNPYRNRTPEQNVLDPASAKSIEEVLTCVEEIMTNYDVDGIHFDDYFYPEKGYDTVHREDRMKYVNRMIKAVYHKVKELDEDAVFGISPAGNIEYAKSIGADLETWLSKPGYVDYIIPQIYWTDQHSADWIQRMYTDTLDAWIEMNAADVPLYVGLGLYRAGEDASDDPGWKKADDNLAKQLETLREKACEGYVLFSAGDFDTKRAQKELDNFQKEVRGESHTDTAT